jgi:hypothetical protein
MSGTNVPIRTVAIAAAFLAILLIAATTFRPPQGFRQFRTVWKDGSYVDGVPGITGGVEFANDVAYDVRSGSYRFNLTGTAPRKDSSITNTPSAN